MEIGKRFDDIGSYNRSMSNAMEDKLFFVEKLSKDEQYVFVDFGCADGTMINNLIEIYGPASTYIGYDKSQTMIYLAKENYRETGRKVIFTSDWEEVISELNKYSCTKKVLILSSVIHEVYSYSTKEEIKEFWDRVKNSNFNYIIIRDMMFRKNMENIPFNDAYKIVRNSSTEDQLKEFEKLYGTVDSVKNAVHFLLKYRWKTNWNREINENYFPISLEELLEIIKEPPYQMIFFDNFKIPFLCDKIKKDFDIDLQYNTHVKLIFKKI